VKGELGETENEVSRWECRKSKRRLLKKEREESRG
jgi:hypothetical protein